MLSYTKKLYLHPLLYIHILNMTYVNSKNSNSTDVLKTPTLASVLYIFEQNRHCEAIRLNKVMRQIPETPSDELSKNSDSKRRKDFKGKRQTDKKSYKNQMVWV